MKVANEVQQLLHESLQVKLRYEKIIKSVLKNEQSGSQIPVRDIIAMTRSMTPLPKEKAIKK